MNCKKIVATFLLLSSIISSSPFVVHGMKPNSEGPKLQSNDQGKEFNLIEEALSEAKEETDSKKQMSQLIGILNNYFNFNYKDAVDDKNGKKVLLLLAGNNDSVPAWRFDAIKALYSKKDELSNSEKKLFQE